MVLRWFHVCDINGKDILQDGLKSKSQKTRISVNHWKTILCKHLSTKCKHTQDLQIQYCSLTLLCIKTSALSLSD